MASGTLTSTKTSSTGSYLETKITWSSSANNDANTSDVTAKLYVRKANHSTTLTQATSGTWTYNLIVNGVGATTNYKSMSVLEGWVLVTQATVSGIAHNNDGTKSITISSSVKGPTGTTLAGHNSTISKSVSLDTIPRATTIDSLKCSTSYMDGAITALYTPKNALFYNKLVVNLNHGGALTLIREANIGMKSATQQTSIINLSDTELSAIYAKVTTTTSAKLRVAYLTYSDSAYTKKVGDTKFKEITLSIPTSIKPTASLSATAIHTNAWIKSLGVYVAGYTSAKLSLTAEPGKGASLSSVSISGDNFTQATTAVTASFASEGTFTFTGKATDTRGRSASSEKRITVLPYSQPIISTLKVERGSYASNKWTASENGPDVRCYFITLLGLADRGNTYSVLFDLDGVVRAPNAGNPEGLKSGMDYAFHFFDIDSEYSHTLKVTVTDLVGESRSAGIAIPTKNATIEFKANGKGIAFGKTSEHDAFECAMDAEFTGSVTIGGKTIDMVVEEGEKDFWSYRKWSSGLLECWGTTFAVTLSFDGTSGLGCWYGTTAPSFSFPTDKAGNSMFIDVPTVQQTCDAGSAIIMSAISHVDSEKVNITYGRFYGGNDDKEVNFHFYARGKWK